MSGRPVKHSVTLHGHRTSISLEDEFWRAFREIALKKDITINALTADIDTARGDLGLASAIRIYVLKHFQEQAKAVNGG
ncbi:MAG: aryl-sulfate sulfotransferase [Rhodobacteraceae bacterium]|nr:aryl-sulfate sulfotransferase [Paracoccaceae bacterium]